MHDHSLFLWAILDTKYAGLTKKHNLSTPRQSDLAPEPNHKPLLVWHEAIYINHFFNLIVWGTSKSIDLKLVPKPNPWSNNTLVTLSCIISTSAFDHFKSHRVTFFHILPYWVILSHVELLESDLEMLGIFLGKEI